MKIAIDMRALPKSGIGNYSQALLKKLPIMFSGVETAAVSDEVTISRRKFHGYSTRLQRLWWEQVDLPRFLKDNKVDILHNPMNFGLPIRQVIKSVVTIHDVIPLVFKDIYLGTNVERTYYRLALQIALNRSARIITDSIFSRDEIVKYMSVPREKIKVIYLACGEEFVPVRDPILQRIPAQKFGLHRPFVLTIGGNEPRKNVDRLVKVFQHLSKNPGVDLAVIGGSWRGTKLSENIRGANNIFFLGPVDQQELVSLYSMAELFVFPSLYEGFGLPVLEAMACGTPVAASNTSSIPEVAGDAAMLFDPQDEEEMSKIVTGILESRETREELSLKGLERAKMFTWENTLMRTMEIYKEVM
ncbi:glycosyltransferase family 4 protein [Desulfosporosinus metallidurans]|uniref:Glycosyltransferase n=1 Tax=Desulfosporosinus metallidurans TaxID=1888891 RepID=A0A1Q8QY45_9FIRM|nr:glycosyltransferase family 1 protein [Desulfosporosinus metallidurans]OLN32160.1 Glycosyltransferase [Desulfosporosinus metallidurans]